jgi:hypothetical protein
MREFFLRPLRYFFIFLASQVNAEIPEVIRTYLEDNIKEMLMGLPKNYTAAQYELISLQVAEKLLFLIEEPVLGGGDLAQVKQEIKEFVLRKIIDREKDNKGPDLTYGQKNLIKIKDKVAEIIMKKFMGKSSDKNELQIKYEDLEIPLEFKIQNDSIYLRLKGIPLENLEQKFGVSGALPVSYCLSLEFKPDKTGESYAKMASIHWLGSFASACPIPSGKGQGNFLLGLGEKLAMAVELEKINMIDQSKIYCKNNKQMMDFRLLRILQNKTPWYQTRGYQPSNTESENDNKNKWQSLTISEVKNFIIEHPNQLDKKERDAAMIFNIKQPIFNAHNTSDKVADFMAYLWSENCAEYSSVMPVISRTMGYKAYYDSILFKSLNQSKY